MRPITREGVRGDDDENEDNGDVSERGVRGIIGKYVRVSQSVS